MKKGFTLIEVSILLIIFIIVTFLVVPLSLNDSEHVKDISRWRNVQQDFENLSVYMGSTYQKEGGDFFKLFQEIISGEIISDIEDYRIKTINGLTPDNKYQFTNFKKTSSGATLAYKFLENSNDKYIGTFLYDVNGNRPPNMWGKDVYGYNINENKFEPFCKNKPIHEQKKDCSKQGTGICCSNYYLIGGDFD